MLGGYLLALVADLHERFAVIAVGGKGDGGFGVGVGDGVAQDVSAGTGHFLWVDEHLLLLGHLHFDLKPLCLGLRVDRFCDLQAKELEVDLLALYRDALKVVARYLKELLDERVKLLCLLVGNACKFLAFCCGHLRRGAQDVQIADNGCERRAYVVGQVGYEFVFALLCHLCRLLVVKLSVLDVQKLAARILER